MGPTVSRFTRLEDIGVRELLLSCPVSIFPGLFKAGEVEEERCRLTAVVAGVRPEVKEGWLLLGC